MGVPQRRGNGLAEEGHRVSEERSAAADRADLRAIVDGWIVWRDCGQWEKLLSAWHPGGRMSSTRFEGLAVDFVAQTKRAYDSGVAVRHAQNGFWCEVAGDRAFTVTGMSIQQRGALEGIAIDVTCTGCFVDFFAYREGRWALDRRQPAYDWDRIDAVDHGATILLDPSRLARFPQSYRHLAYLQEQAGQTINLDLPAARGAGFDALIAAAKAWIGNGGTA